jgi:hypothetical protein
MPVFCWTTDHCRHGGARAAKHSRTLGGVLRLGYTVKMTKTRLTWTVLTCASIAKLSHYSRVPFFRKVWKSRKLLKGSCHPPPRVPPPSPNFPHTPLRCAWWQLSLHPICPRNASPMEAAHRGAARPIRFSTMMWLWWLFVPQRQPPSMHRHFRENARVASRQAWLCCTRSLPQQQWLSEHKRRR